MEIPPIGDFLLNHLVPLWHLSEVFLTRQVLSLCRPEIKHACHHIQRVTDAAQDLTSCDSSILAERVVSLDDPHVVKVSLRREPTVLQGLVQCVVEVAI